MAFSRSGRASASLLALALASPAMAQLPTMQDTGSSGDIIFTGTRDAHPTTQKTLMPITVVSAGALGQAGQIDLRDALQQLAPSMSR